MEQLFGHGIHELPLIIFTALAPATAIAFLLITITYLLGVFSDDEKPAVLKSTWVIWAVLAIGFVAAGLHLKMPLHAPWALAGLGRSPLTNEVVAGVAFFGIGGVWWLFHFFKKLPELPEMVNKVWMVLAALAGLIFIYFIAIAYDIETVPTWRAATTQASLMLIGVVNGPLLARMVMSVARVDLPWRWGLGLLAIAGVAAVMLISVVGVQISDAGTTRSAIKHAITLLPALHSVIRYALALLAAGFIVWAVPIVRRQDSIWYYLASFLLISLGLMAVRLIFYSFHMTVGLV